MLLLRMPAALDALDALAAPPSAGHSRRPAPVRISTRTEPAAFAERYWAASPPPPPTAPPPPPCGRGVYFWGVCLVTVPHLAGAAEAASVMVRRAECCLAPAAAFWKEGEKVIT